MPVNSRPAFGAYLRSLWQRRAFIFAFAKASVDKQNTKSRLGQFWQVMDPVITMAIYWFLFGFLLYLFLYSTPSFELKSLFFFSKSLAISKRCCRMSVGMNLFCNTAWKRHGRSGSKS